jgi:hypothetical protein
VKDFVAQIEAELDRAPHDRQVFLLSTVARELARTCCMGAANTSNPAA